MALFEVVEGEPLDGCQLEPLHAVLGGWVAVVTIFAYLFCVLLVNVVVVVVVVVVDVVVVVVVYPSLDTASGREGEAGAVGEVEEASDGDELEGAVVVYRKVGEDTDGDVVVTVVVEGVRLADDLDVRPLWELVLGWDMAGGCPARRRRRGARGVAV